MANNLKLPDGYVLYDYQVAGHTFSGNIEELGFLMNSETKRVFKPLQATKKKGDTKTYGETERMFDSIVWHGARNENVDSSDMLQLREFVPKFYGVRKLTISGVDHQFLELENICAKFKKPCLVDIKVGKKDRKPGRVSEVKNLKYDILNKHGFRVSGLLLFDSNSDQYKKYDKSWALKLINEKNGFNKFFSIFFKRNHDLPVIIVEAIIDKLMELRQFFELQHSVNFFRSSLLIIYESDTSELQCLKSKSDVIEKNIVDVRIIDFTKSKLGDQKDEKFLYGLKNLIAHLELYLTTYNLKSS